MMRRLLTTLVLLVILYAPIGQQGLKALSQLTDLKVISGYYIYQEEGTIICATGYGNGDKYHVFGLWLSLWPKQIWKERVSSGI